MYAYLLLFLFLLMEYDYLFCRLLIYNAISNIKINKCHMVVTLSLNC